MSEGVREGGVSGAAAVAKWRARSDEFQGIFRTIRTHKDRVFVETGEVDTLGQKQLSS